MRIENLLVVRRASGVEERRERLQASGEGRGGEGHGNFLCFERLTLLPIQSCWLLDRSEVGLPPSTGLSLGEVRWLDGYHAEVWAALSPMLDGAGDEGALEWLREACAPLPPCIYRDGDGDATRI